MHSSPAEIDIRQRHERHVCSKQDVSIGRTVDAGRSHGDFAEAAPASGKY